MSEREGAYGMQEQEPMDFSGEFEVEALIAWLVKNSPVGEKGERSRIITLLSYCQGELSTKPSPAE